MLRESHRPGIEPATCKPQVQRPTAKPLRKKTAEPIEIRSTHLSHHRQSRTEGLYWNKFLLPAFPFWLATRSHWCYHRNVCVHIEPYETWLDVFCSRLMTKMFWCLWLPSAPHVHHNTYSLVQLPQTLHATIIDTTVDCLQSLRDSQNSRIWAITMNSSILLQTAANLTHFICKCHKENVYLLSFIAIIMK